MVGGPFYDDGEMYVLTAYFTDPNHVCDDENNRPKGVVGDELYLQVGVYEYMKAPATWEGACINKMDEGKMFFWNG